MAKKTAAVMKAVKAPAQKGVTMKAVKAPAQKGVTMKHVKPDTHEAATEEKPVAAPQPPANVIWRSEKAPPPSVKVGMRVIDLPSAEAQRKGFYHPEAGTLTRISTNYKIFKPKG